MTESILLAGVEVVWRFVEKISYWLAACGGVTSLMIYHATKADKYKVAAVAFVIGYMAIEMVGSII